MGILNNFWIKTRGAAVAAGIVAASAAWTAATPTAARAQNDISVTVDKQAVEFSGGKPSRVGERVLVPLRGVFEKMGAQVAYDSATKSVRATRGATDVQLTVGSKKGVVNGKPITLDAATEVTDGSVLVPLRFLSENLGAEVDYDGASRTVAIDTSKIPAPVSTGAVESATVAPTTDASPEVSASPEATVSAAPLVDASPSPEGSPAASPLPEASPAASPSPEASASPAAAVTTTDSGNAGRMDSAPTASAPSDNAAASDNGGFMKYLPWIIGALVLAGLAAFLLTRNKGGQVIASDDNRRS